jgi:hypothetical protein
VLEHCGTAHVEAVCQFLYTFILDLRPSHTHRTFAQVRSPTLSLTEITLTVGVCFFNTKIKSYSI